MFRQSEFGKKPRHWRTGVAITAVAALSVGLGGCTVDPANDQKVITIFGEQGGQMDLNTNSFTLELEKKFDVDIDFNSTRSS